MLSGPSRILRGSTACLLVVGSTVVIGQGPDPVSVLADARSALGGDARLQAVTAFSVSGSQARTFEERTIQSDVDISCVLPEKFVRVRRQVQQTPFGTDVTTFYEGFNGDEPIRGVVYSRPMPPLPMPPAPTTPAEIAAAHARLMNGLKRSLVETALPLFAQSMSAHPLTFTGVERVQLPSGPADVVDVRGPDGSAWHLYVDASTHRPAALSWMAKPIVMMSISTMVTVRRGGGPPAPPNILPSQLPADPTVGMADVEWRIAISDYKTADGITWPHRFTTTIDGKPHEDLKLGTFKINPKIDAKLFTPRQ